MKIIIHGIGKNDKLAPHILALRAAHGHLNAKEGEVMGVRFEDGSTYAVKRNKRSVSVWKQL